MAQLLAAGDESKIWVGAFFALIWFVGMIVSALSKVKKEREKREALVRGPRPVAEAPPLPRQPTYSQPTPMRQPAQPPALRKAAKAARAPKKPSKVFVDRLEGMNAPPRQWAEAGAAAPSGSARAPVTQVTAVDALGGPRENRVADELRIALRPRNVKLQFVLNELLRPPLALRGDPQQADAR